MLVCTCLLFVRIDKNKAENTRLAKDFSLSFRDVLKFALESSGDFYFSASMKYLGDQRSAYHQTLAFTLTFHPTNHTANYANGRVALIGEDLDYQLW